MYITLLLDQSEHVYLYCFTQYSTLKKEILTIHLYKGLLKKKKKKQ